MAAPWMLGLLALPMKSCRAGVVPTVDDAVGTGIVVLAKPSPFGPKLTVWPPITAVIVDTSLPIAYVVPLITAAVGPTENVRPPAVTSDIVGTEMVVVTKPTPFDPKLTVWPPITVVVADTPLPIANVVPLMTASVDPMANVRPPAVTPNIVGTGMVVVAKPTPFGPKLTVWPSTTVVVADAPLPIANVMPLMTASVDPTANVTPPAVTWDNTAAGTVVLAKLTPPGPKLSVWPSITLVIGEASPPIA